MHKKIKLLLSTAIVLLTLAGCGGDNGNGKHNSEHGLLNNPPVAKELKFKVKEENILKIALKATDTDGDNLSYKIVTKPKHGRISGKTPNITYTPTTGYFGNDFFTYKANDGIADSNIAKVAITVEKSSNENTNIETLKELLEDPSVPYTSDEDYNKSEYAKKHLPDKEARRLYRMQDLVSVAKDPDPKWFSTNVDRPVIIAKSGQEYTIHLKKEDKNGVAYAPVDNDKLHLVVKIQRAKNSFEYVTNVDIDQYAHWDGDGVLKINVPDNLEKGRLLIGVRPNFSDVAVSAIAERWSTLISAEVWKMRDNVVVVNPKNVLFPIENDKLRGLSKESIFTLADIAKETKRYLVDEKTLVLPIILKDITIQKGKLISYIFQGKPYAGRVKKVVTKNNQQFIILSPEYFNVYEIMDTEEEFAQKEGLLPAHVVYREGEAFVSDINESDPIEFRARGIDKEAITRFFTENCTVGKSEFTYSPNFSLHPLDASINISMQALSGDTECKWKATTTPFKLDKLLAKLGPAGAVLEGIFGAGGELKPTGTVTLKVDQAPGFGVKAGFSLAKGGNFKVNSLAKTAGGIGSRDLTLLTSSASAQFSGTVGLDFSIEAISDDGAIGIVFKWLHINYTTIGLSSKAEITQGLYANIKNAREVYESKKSSDIAFSITGSAEISATPDMQNLFDALSIKAKLEAKTPKVKILEAKATAISTFTSITDNGEGRASVNGLALTSRFLRKLLSDTQGILAPSDDKSSVYNQKTEDISYNKDECNIEVPAIACAGWMCGSVKGKIKLCDKDDNKTIGVQISAVVAEARVAEAAKVSGTISGKGEVSVSIKGSPLKPSKTSLNLNDSSERILFTKMCPAEPTVLRGKTIVTGSSKDGKEKVTKEARNIVICHDDDYRGDPHIVTGDGLGYDYFASGDYILSRIKNVTGYEIQGRFLPGYKTSWPQAVALQVGKDVVEIQGVKRDFHGDGTGRATNALILWVNGKRIHGTRYYNAYSIGKDIIKLPSGGIIAITKTGFNRVLRFAYSMAVIWPEDSKFKNYGLILSVAEKNDPFVHIQVARPNDFAGQEQGLMGNNDGNPKNDFIRRNGEVLGVDHNISFTELYALFGTDWLVRPYESLFRNPEAIKPQFPTDVVTLTPEQRALGEQACAALAGFYREACIIDVGLTGSENIVKEYYSNTKDLNKLSELIVKPNTDITNYSMYVDNYKPDPNSTKAKIIYTQDIHIKHLNGKGKYILLVRPPKGAEAVLDTGKRSIVGDGNTTLKVTVNCKDKNTETNNNAYPKVGAIQLWAQDSLSGAAAYLYSEQALGCIDKNYQPNFIDKSKFPSAINGKDLNNGKYTFNVDVVDSKYGNYGFNTKIYIDEPTENNLVSVTNSYTHNFRNKKVFKLYYVVTTPFGQSKTFVKNIKLINYEFADNTVFPDDITCLDLVDGKYTFDINVTSPLDKNVSVKIYVQDWYYSNKTKVIDGTSFTLDFLKYSTYNIKYIVTNSLGDSKTYYKQISYTPTKFTDNTFSKFKVLIKVSDLSDGKYTFDINITSTPKENLNMEIFKSNTDWDPDKDPFVKVSSSNIYEHDFLNGLRHFYLKYNVKTAGGCSKEYLREVYLTGYGAIDHSTFPTDINASLLNDGKYTFDINVSSPLNEEMKIEIYKGKKSSGGVKVSDSNSYTHDFYKESSFDLDYYVYNKKGDYLGNFTKHIKLVDYNFKDNTVIPKYIHMNDLKNGKYTFEINATSSLNDKMEYLIEVRDIKTGKSTKVSNSNIYTHDFINGKKSFVLYYRIKSLAGYTYGYQKVELVDYVLEDHSSFSNVVDVRDLVDGKYTFEMNITSPYNEELTFGTYYAGEKISDGKFYTHDFNKKSAFNFNYGATTNSGYFQLFHKYIKLKNDGLIDNSKFPTELKFSDLNDGKYTFDLNISSEIGLPIKVEMYMGDPNSGGIKVSDNNSYTHDFKNEKSFYLYYKVYFPSGYVKRVYKGHIVLLSNKLSMYAKNTQQFLGKYSDANSQTISSAEDKEHNLLYLADGANGLTVLDISDTQHPKKIGTYKTDGKSCHSVVLSSDKKTIYLADYNRFKGVYILDVNNPKSPTLIKHLTYEGHTSDIALSSDNKTLYIANGAKGMRVINVSTPSEATEIASLDTDGIANSIKLSKDCNKAYIADAQNGLIIIDISDPFAPVIEGHLLTNGYAYNLVASEDDKLLYLADYVKGLIIIDINDTTNPQIINSYDTPILHVALANNTTLYALARGKLFKFDINDSSNIKLEQTYTISVYNFNFTLSEDNTKAYLAEYTNGIVILDLDLPYQSYKFANYNSGGYTFATSLCNTDFFNNEQTRLCVSDGDNGFLILNMTEDNNLTLFKHINVGGFTRDFTLFGGTAYIVNDSGGFTAVDIAETYNIENSFEGNTSTHDIQSSKNNPHFLYVADTKKGLVIVRDKNIIVGNELKRELQYYSSCDTNGTAYSLAISKNEDKAYLVNNDNTMVVVDISDLKNPHIIGKWQNSNGIFEHILLSKDNKTAYIADGNNGLLVLDIQDPSKPILLNSVKLQGHAETIKLTQNEQIAYVTVGLGVAMVDLSADTPMLVTTYQIGGYTDGITFNSDESKAYIAAGENGVVGLHLNRDTLYYKKDFGQNEIKIKIPKDTNVTLDFSVKTNRDDIIEIGDYDEEITPNEYPNSVISIPITSIAGKTGQTVLTAKIKFGSIEYTRIIYVNIYK